MPIVSRSIALIVRCIIITGTGICVSTAMQVPASTTNRIVSTVRYPTRNTISPLELENAAGHYPQDNDFYTQPGDLYRLLPADEKDRLTSNFTAATADVPEPIRIRAIARFYQADEHCGKEMARKTQTDLKKILEEVKRQQALESR